MSVNGLGAPLSGLQANQLRMDVSANNVANVNTDKFKASRVSTSDLGYINDIGQGTRVSATYAPPGPAPVAPTAEGGVVEQSNTDPVVERTDQMAASTAYSANAGVFRTNNEMSQTLMNVVG